MLLALAAFLSLGCGDGPNGRPGGTETQPTNGPPAEPPLRQTGLTNAAEFQSIPTYDGSGQAVHPDIADFPDGWQGYRYWLVMTPLPYDSDGRENPSILVSNDGSSWQPPPGVTNPLVPPPPCDHNSDPDIVYNPRTDELYVYYTEVLRAERCGAGVNENSLKLITSSDGVHWSAPRTVMRFDLDTEPLYVSPAVVYRDGVFELWMVSNRDEVVHATSTDGVSWSPLEPLEIGQVQWHLDVLYIEPKAEYWMLFVDAPVAGAALKFATSADGLRWRDYAAPLLTPGAGWDDERIYRSTFLYDPAGDLLRVWYSAKNRAGEWHIGYTEAGYADLIDWLGLSEGSPRS